ncbi:ferritin family protein [Williamwhitmania taraxaci]|uniref:Rubrerythrin n=1 Tax=Williamwhitmania taraxaci TaxID=1640674 RepID=A0A1G6H3J7_9BACT|nr:ferritin family protein [Williamwhitmania taraxaci]SDB88723.1 Rubrerythrin [Williamwhitmania taraxaci]
MKRIFLFAFVGLVALASCNQSAPEKTIANLKDGIKGETTASAKYSAFAQKAREEGYDTIAKLFDAASKAEMIHATNHTKVLTDLGVAMEAFNPEFEVKTTAENLQAAITGETYEIDSMYPRFLDDAKAEKVEKATKSFTWAMDTEKKHQSFYAASLEALNGAGEKTLPFEYFVCPVCGNTYDKATLEPKCGFCQTDQEKFIAI